MEKQICKMEDCTGCFLCFNVCPSGAIMMKYNNIGFLIPVIIEDICTECRACIRICPQNNKNRIKLIRSEIPPVYACYHKNQNVISKSASGGAFYALADYVLKKNGSVFGASYNSIERIVSHIKISDIIDLIKIQGSKYIQSEIGYSYKLVKSEILKNRYVLFSGCPCQIQALYSYLGKDYENLITVDVICHGVGSTGFFNKYLKEIETGKTKIYGYSFRDKTFGWLSKCISVEYANGRKKIIRYRKDAFMRCYYKRAIYRQSCYSCENARLPRQGDFTLGDYFEIPSNVVGRKVFKMGVSMILINSQKAKKILNLLKNELVLIQRPLEEAIRTNSNIVTPSKKPLYYDNIIFSDAPVSELANEYCKINALISAKAKIKEILIRYFKNDMGIVK